MKITRPLAAAAIASSLVLVGAPAFAHVTVNPDTASQGGYTKLTFRVPDESDTASTTKLEVQLPQGIDSARTRPVPGWKATVANGTITWAADSAATAVKPGEFEEFDISVGPLPEVDSLEFKVLQTYSDGSVVRWVEEPAAAGQPEPEHPAPVLTLTPASGDESAAPAAGSDTSAAPEGSQSADDSDGDSKAPLVLSIIALVVSVLGAGAALLRRRQA